MITPLDLLSFSLLMQLRSRLNERSISPCCLVLVFCYCLFLLRGQKEASSSSAPKPVLGLFTQIFGIDLRRNIRSWQNLRVTHLQSMHFFIPVTYPSLALFVNNTLSSSFCLHSFQEFFVYSSSPFLCLPSFFDSWLLMESSMVLLLTDTPEMLKHPLLCLHYAFMLHLSCLADCMLSKSAISNSSPGWSQHIIQLFHSAENSPGFWLHLSVLSPGHSSHPWWTSHFQHNCFCNTLLSWINLCKLWFSCPREILVNPSCRFQ